MAGEKIGWGTEVHIFNDATPPVKIELEGVFNITLPNPQVEDVEVTHYKSPNREREYIAGLIENGEIQIEMNYIAGSVTDLTISAAKAAGTVRNMEVIIPTSVGASKKWKFTFPCYVKGYERAIPVDDRQTAVATIKVAGAVTEAQVP
jgi:predicted secreted protein